MISLPFRFLMYLGAALVTESVINSKSKNKPVEDKGDEKPNEPDKDKTPPNETGGKGEQESGTETEDSSE